MHKNVLDAQAFYDLSLICNDILNVFGQLSSLQHCFVDTLHFITFLCKIMAMYFFVMQVY